MLRLFVINLFSSFTIVLFFASSVFAQKESANWYFGEYAGLNFNANGPKVLIDGKLNTNEGCATISNSNGNLLFYTDGVSVWNKNHEIMPNGNNLFGHSSSTESALIIPKPGSKTNYFIFTIDQPSYYLKNSNSINGVNYSEVDIRLNNNLGDVILENKNKHLITYNSNDNTERFYKSTEKITAVTHSNGQAIWVITFFMDRFYSFLVDKNGVNEQPIVSKVQQLVRPVLNDDGANVTAIGYLKVSPNGKKIAIAHSSTNAGSPRSGRKKSGKVLVYDFNNASGIVSNQIEILAGSYPYGVEFSPNSKLLYVTNSNFNETDTFINGELLQFDLSVSNIKESVQIIKSSQNIAGGLQLALDGKIYRAGYKVFGTGLDISIINSPNTLGLNCNYIENSFNLGGKAAKLGLPPFVQSIFLYTFDYEFSCIGDNTHFYITSDEPYDNVLWNFGDGHTSTDMEPYHKYDASGNYTVQLTMFLNGVEREPLIKKITIAEPPEVMTDTFELVQCDSFDDNSSDGFSTFNLQQAIRPVSLYTSEDIEGFFYHSEEDAVSDSTNENAISNIYRNKSLDEIIYAKIVNSAAKCYSIATIKLRTIQPKDIGMNQYVVCDFDGDSKEEIDLNQIAENIILNKELPQDVNISFYEREADANLGLNALPNKYITSSKNIYIRAERQNACYGNGVLKLQVRAFPKLKDQIVKVCKEDYPIKINSGISTNDSHNYKFKWSNDEVTNEILIFHSGLYSVTIYDLDLICSYNVNIQIIENEIPEIQELIIYGHEINVKLKSKENFVFALDNRFGEFQIENVFKDISEGLHTLYVKDIEGCNIYEREFYIFGFPKYFTPNSDGINDTWMVYGLNVTKYQNTVLELKIYDRYGKVINVFNPLLKNGWNGTYKGEILGSDDYWYEMSFPTGEIYRGHFSLNL